MALYSVVDSLSFVGLLHVGFRARIESISCRKYLASSRTGNCVLVGEEDAPLWYIVSRDLGSTSKTENMSPRCVVATGEPPSRTRYLSLHSGHPSVSDTPCTVRISVPEPQSGSTNVSFAFAHVRQDKGCISVRGGVNGLSVQSGKAGRTESFSLSVAAASIGRGMVPGGSVYISATQALVLALLELGVRFRLRSIHGRVLKRPASAEGLYGNSEHSNSSSPTKKNRTPLIVLQDGPKSRIDQSSDEELVFEAARRSSQQGQSSFYFSFTEIMNGGFLSISPKALDKSQVLLGQSAALVLPKGSDRNAAVSSVAVEPGGAGWGVLHLGSESSDKSTSEAKTDWLMAGPRGRLETRNHCGPWESFKLEFVEQSFSAALRELPPSEVVSNADAADRAAVRAEIAAQVAAARAPMKSAALDAHQKEKKSKFNHAAAVAALSLENDSQKAASSSLESKEPRNVKKSGAGGSRMSKSASPAHDGTAAGTPSALPRNAAAKKASKRAKKKKKQQQQKALQQSNATSSGGRTDMSSSPASKKSNEAVSNQDGMKERPVGAESSVSAQQVGNGPPCAACGRPISGTYTKAQGRDFHPQCFCCRSCRRPLLPGASQFREHGGVPYCNGCYANSIAPKCARCAKPIMEAVTTAMEKTWHKNCLTCVICQLPLTQQFWLYADKPNEPRCSRCVTGSEEALQGVGYGGRGNRAVNLPGPLFNRGSVNSGSMSPNITGSSSTGSGRAPLPGGRARLAGPVVNPAVSLGRK